MVAVVEEAPVVKVAGRMVATVAATTPPPPLLPQNNHNAISIQLVLT